MLIFICSAKASSAQSVPEYQIKAVFVFNFAQFVQWPDSAFSTPEAPLVIGILGDDPFRDYLDETVRGEKINGHPLVVERYSSREMLKNCHILYISYERPDQLKQILSTLRSSSTLTIGDAVGFTQYGGMIQFFTEKNKTRIQINHERAKHADLNISAKLLRLAEIVNY